MFRSKWQGAWKNNESEYARSYPISKEAISAIPTECFRIVIKRNKNYQAGGNRPAYTFAFADENWESCDATITSKDLQYNFLDDVFSEALADLDNLEIAIVEAHNVNRNAPTETDEEFCQQGYIKDSLDAISDIVEHLRNHLERYTRGDE